MTEAADFKETVKLQADIVRIVGDYVKLKKAGAQNYSGLCPFHNEKTPSFSVHATRQFFHCFGCGVSGDVFSFVQKIENVTFPEAVRAVAQKLGIALPKMEYSSPAEARDAKLRTVLLDIHERACGFFQECLRRPEGARAREYLTGRGLSEEMIREFRIGYAPDSGFLIKDRLKSEFDEEALRESGLFSWKESSQPSAISTQEPTTSDHRPTTTASMYSKFRNRVMFPIANESGRVIAFTGRTLATDEKAGPKYLNSPETAIYSKSKVLFNLDHAKEATRKLDYAILVEGQMDCISVYAAGFHNVIASSGTAFTDLQARLLGRFSKNVVVNFDPDTAGAKATERTLGLLVQEEFQIKVLTLETGFDPDLFIRRKGKDAYAGALRNSQPYFTYLIDRARAQFPIRSGEGKVKAVNYLLPHIQQVPSRIVRDELTREIAQKLNIDSAVLRQELKHAATNRSAAALKSPVESQVTDAEKILVRALTSAREMTSEQHVSSRDGVDEEFDPARQAHFVLRNEPLHHGLATESLVEALLAAPDSADVMALALSDGERSLLASILMKEAEELAADRLEGAVKALRRIQLRRKLERVQQELAAKRSQEPGRMQALLEEKMRLKRALMDAGLMEEGAAPPAA
ncbi:MAG TPA: DNA primase [Terriglobales bacterium]|jgi:DNA primase|nr:DNA primase [Terriglobales bacterium]